MTTPPPVSNATPPTATLGELLDAFSLAVVNAAFIGSEPDLAKRRNAARNAVTEYVNELADNREAWKELFVKLTHVEARLRSDVERLTDERDAAKKETIEADGINGGLIHAIARLQADAARLESNVRAAIDAARPHDKEKGR